MMAVAQDRAARRFARLDRNGDGVVTVAEAAERQGPRHGRRADTTMQGGKRGPVTQAMMEERILKRFARFDTDGDGIITIEDVRGQ